MNFRDFGFDDRLVEGIDATGVVSKKEGISEQSAEWEDIQERGIPAQNTGNKAERYIKDPSPEEINHEDAEDQAIN